jgi:hypothetical protein
MLKLTIYYDLEGDGKNYWWWTAFKDNKQGNIPEHAIKILNSWGLTDPAKLPVLEKSKETEQP